MPIIGDDAALEYHLREAAKAIKAGGNVDDYAKTMQKNGASEEQAQAFKDLVRETASLSSKFETMVAEKRAARNFKEVSGEGISKMERAKAELAKVDYDKLGQSQKDVYDVFMGNKSSTTLKAKDIDDIMTLEQGGSKAGARKIMVKHGGADKTGGLSGEELVNIENVLLRGKIDENSFEMREKSLRYAYNLNKDGIKLRVVVDEFNEGKKVFDYYSDRNFKDYETAIIKQQPDPKAASESIIPQPTKNEAKEVKGDGWTARDGKLTYLDEAKFELNDVLKGQTGIDSAVTASLAWLKSRHPEMFKNKRAVKELIDYVIDNPNIVKSGDSKNSSYLAKTDGKKIKDIVINKEDKKIIHANRRRMSAEERDRWQGRPPSLHTDTKPAGANGADARSSTSNASIILQNFKNTAKNIKSLTSIISKMNDSKKVGEIMLKAAHNKGISAKNKIHILNAAAKRISELESKAK